uniref:Uncharacterized protein n=1 Tax=Arundo donax TaxID=35708 RepID=A0A0A9DPA8_ARUDO
MGFYVTLALFFCMFPFSFIIVSEPTDFKGSFSSRCTTGE